jgi:cobyrinic acid a,c-diamide synthase
MLQEQTQTVYVPRLIVAAIQGRSGKTTFTIGLLRALRNRGLLPQGFKKGPDYIDPSWSTFASGLACRNLDAVMMTNEQIIHSVCAHAQSADLAVVEGAMGIFDGLDWQGSNSTAELAVLLQAPIVLVVSGQRITRSVAALINGVVNFDKRIHVAGVVLNQVARARHQNIMTQAIEAYCDVPLLGALPKTKDIEIPDRHLGLIPATEQEALHSRVDRLGKLIEDNVDIDAILQIAKAAPPLTESLPQTKPIEVGDSVRIGVFKDRAFSFYYPENFESLEAQGAEVVPLDSLNDPHLPELDGLYLGGGFPEMLGEELAANKSLREDVRHAADDGMPIYAECGGLMYLSEEIVSEKNHYPMAGVFHCNVVMGKRPVGHGYSTQRVLEGNQYFPTGTIVKGHEFHHSHVEFAENAQIPEFAYETTRGKGLYERDSVRFDGMLYKNTLACYHHFHALTSQEWAKNFVILAKEYKVRRKNK